MSRDWRPIEQAARDVARDAQDRIAATPLVVGEHIAWTVNLYGRTDGLSQLHRVATVDGEPETYCDEKIPAPIAWLDLAVWPVGNLDRCRWCAKGYALAAREDAA